MGQSVSQLEPSQVQVQVVQVVQVPHTNGGELSLSLPPSEVDVVFCCLHPGFFFCFASHTLSFFFVPFILGCRQDEWTFSRAID